MQLRRRPSEHAEVAAESMNDIMFFLMLFFLIISTMANPNVIKVALPQAEASKQMNKQPLTVSVALGSLNEPIFYIDKTLVTEEQLESRLKTDLAGLEDPTVVLRIDKGLTVKDLKQVLTIGEKLKIKMVMASTAGGGGS